MESIILSICYLIGSITFILGLKMLSSPASARKGNLIAAGGMLLAILATIFLYESDGIKLGKMHLRIFYSNMIGQIESNSHIIYQCNGRGIRSIVWVDYEYQKTKNSLNAIYESEYMT